MSGAPNAPAIRELVPLMYVGDMNRAVAFYRDQLGFKIVAAWEPAGQLAWCRLQRDRSAVMLQQAEAEDGPADGRGLGVIFCFICTDADAMYAELASRGVTVTAPEVAFFHMKQVFLRDPDGYQLCFESPTE